VATVSELLVVGGIFVLAFASAFVPLISIEAALVVAAATGTSHRLLVVEVLFAAAGQMVGKTCFFLGGRTAFTRWTRRKQTHAGTTRRLSRLIARAARRRASAAVMVFISAVTGLPPFALVSALAGGWRLRLSSFVVLGLAGRAARFAGVLLVPHIPAL
jgi:membrane protein YqaA with SNARE-associated domain